MACSVLPDLARDLISCTSVERLVQSGQAHTGCSRSTRSTSARRSTYTFDIFDDRFLIGARFNCDEPRFIGFLRFKGSRRSSVTSPAPCGRLRSALG